MAGISRSWASELLRGYKDDREAIVAKKTMSKRIARSLAEESRALSQELQEEKGCSLAVADALVARTMVGLGIVMLVANGVTEAEIVYNIKRLAKSAATELEKKPS